MGLPSHSSNIRIGWNLTDFVSLPDGRVIYVRDGNFWELRMDPRNGGPAGEPRQLTNWSGLWLGYTSVTSDGKRLVFQRSAPQTTVNVADIEANGTHLSAARRLTLNEYSNVAETWTPDSRALVFPLECATVMGGSSSRLSTLTSRNRLSWGAENVGGSAISPDGAWMFYSSNVKQRQRVVKPSSGDANSDPWRGATPWC